LKKGGEFMKEAIEATKKCPSCDEKISVKAKRCPHCRHDLRGFFARHPILTILGVLFITPFVIAGMVGSSLSDQNSGTNAPEPERQTVFNGAVSFDGTQFLIGNQDKYDCLNSRMEVNGGFLKGGYTLEGYLLEAGHNYTVGAAQFTDGDGNRFNPFIKKPQTFTISCMGNNELTAVIRVWEFK